MYIDEFAKHFSSIEDPRATLGSARFVTLYAIIAGKTAGKISNYMQKGIWNRSKNTECCPC